MARVSDIKIFEDLKSELDKEAKNWETHKDDTKLVKALKSIVNKYSPDKFNATRMSQVATAIQKEQEKLEANLSPKLKGNKSIDVDFDNEGVFNSVQNKGGASDDDRVIGYHKNMLRRVTHLEKNLNKLGED